MRAAVGFSKILHSTAFHHNPLEFWGAEGPRIERSYIAVHEIKLYALQAQNIRWDCWRYPCIIIAFYNTFLHDFIFVLQFLLIVVSINNTTCASFGIRILAGRGTILD